MKSNAGAVMRRIAGRLKKATDSAPKILANVGQKFFTDNFQKQAWRDLTYKKWPARQDKKNKRSLLVGRTRKLLGSVRRSIKVVNDKMIVWGTSVPYAVVHNEGFNGIVNRRSHKRNKIITIKTGGGYDRGGRRIRSSSRQMLGARHNVSSSSFRMRIPQRRFMGNSRILNALLVTKYKQILKAAA